MRSMRGRALSMIFQEPMTSLNPVMRVGDQVAEAVRAHEKVTGTAARARAVDMLRLVGIPDPASRTRAFPHELSGGMRQRIMIAMALACRPQLLIADEPTTALDVTVQAQVLDLIRGLQREFAMAVLFITHDLGVVAQMADRVAVMYAGRIVEEAPVELLFSDPRHPYTRGLLASMPDAGKAGCAVHPIPGAMPRLASLPSGCAFHPRCTAALPSRCDREMPPAVTATAMRSVHCWLHAS
jgi:oligopeptide/dipeptide ABC transporter ATP-binding protein